jgi:hypothetical protein
MDVADAAWVEQAAGLEVALHSQQTVGGRAVQEAAGEVVQGGSGEIGWEKGGRRYDGG